MKTNYINKMAHEVKNPLAICMGYLEMMNVNDIGNTIRYLDIIKRQVKSSLLILNDYMINNRVIINRNTMNLRVLLDDCANYFLIYTDMKLVNFIYSDKEICLNADYDKLKQVIVNLFKNSIEEGCKNIWIDVETFQSGYNIFVKNDEGNIKVKKNSNKIGLKLCNDIISLHGGSIKYKKGNKEFLVEIFLPK